MSERDRPGRAPEGSSFAPVAVAPGGGRAPLLVAVVVLALVSGSFVLAQLDPDQEPAQAVVGSIAPRRTIVPETPVPTVVLPQPTATALPAREWFTGPGAPMVDVPVLTEDSIRWLRLGTAVHADVPLATPGRDLLMAGRPDGTVCLCWRDPGTGSGESTALELISLDHDLRVRVQTTVTLVDGIDATRPTKGQTQVALEPGPGGQFAYLARAERSVTTWQVSLDIIDLARGRIVDSVDLLPVPATDRSEVLVVDPVTLRVAPDGRHVLVGSGVERETRDGRSVAVGRAWMVGLDGPTIGRVVRVDDIAEPGGERRLETCSWVAFSAVDQVATGCRAGGRGSAPTFQVRRYTVLGRDLGPVDGDPALGDPERVLIDSANGVAYTWDPRTHTLFAVDLARGGWRSSTPSDDDRDAPDDPVRLAERPPPGPLPAWSEGRSATARALEQTLIGSPDGSLLFAIGDGSTPGSSSGVRVFDARTLRLLERWPALASYRGLTSFDQGRFLAALGRPGLTSTGGPAEWGVSITVHDATTGGPVVRIGDSEAQMATGFPWAMRAADAP